MKIEVTLKDPDGFYDCVAEAVRKSLSDLGLSEDEIKVLVDRRSEKTWDKLEKWVDCQEYVSLEFDLDTMIATVVTRKQ